MMDGNAEGLIFKWVTGGIIVGAAESAAFWANAVKQRAFMGRGARVARYRACCPPARAPCGKRVSLFSAISRGASIGKASDMRRLRRGPHSVCGLFALSVRWRNGVPRGVFKVAPLAPHIGYLLKLEMSYR
jgi:hypothetical protein